MEKLGDFGDLRIISSRSLLVYYLMNCYYRQPVSVLRSSSKVLLYLRAWKTATPADKPNNKLEYP